MYLDCIYNSQLVKNKGTFILQLLCKRRMVIDMAITPPRSVRIPDVLWKKAKAKAKVQHTTVTAVIVKALFDWINE